MGREDAVVCPSRSLRQNAWTSSSDASPPEACGHLNGVSRSLCYPRVPCLLPLWGAASPSSCAAWASNFPNLPQRTKSRAFQGSLFLLSYTPGECYGKGPTSLCSAPKMQSFGVPLPTPVSAVTLPGAVWVRGGCVVLLLHS